ncbi:MAG: atpC [Candidatus Saccharibacteria bacterium]|nr:atpC [Candidatus Saccharibacteria bacterium]
MAVRQDASTGQLIDDDKPEAVDADGKPTMALKVYSPYKIYFDDAAYSISAVNETGPFDILPKHHNFITLVSTCKLNIQSPTGAQEFEISGGLMHVKSDKVILFLNV